MIITYNWLKDFLNIKVAPKVLAEKLTNAGLEVVSFEATQDDFVFEIEITSNRPDWLSVLGIAREVAAITGEKLKLEFDKYKIPKTKYKNLEIKIEDKKDCPLYTAQIIKNVKVGPSPDWLRKRLELVGCRSINNIVDITNYVLFQTGHPLHAFDLDLLAQEKIIVRRAKPGEKITTLDNQPRLLSPEILIIADKDKPLAIAGVMGGKETEVTQKTQNILLESAVFDPLLVRRGRQKLGLQSASAYRFERGVELENTQTASAIARELICALAHGQFGGFQKIGVSKSAARIIKLDIKYINRILGANIPVLKIKQILNGLGFKFMAGAKNILMVKVPSFRQDVKLPIDLVEEVARIYGFAAITPSLPAIKPDINIPSKRDGLTYIKDILLGLGLQEVITYSLVDRELLASSRVKPDAQLVEILNPLSKDQEVLRPTILPSLIRCVAHNLNQQQEYVNIFEIANVFLKQDASVQEELSLGIALCGSNSFLMKQGLVKDEVTLLHLKGILESLFNRLGVRNYDFKHSGSAGFSIAVDQQEIGVMLNLNAQILTAFDIKNKQVILAEINLEKMLAYLSLEKKFSGIPKYPAITRDISFVIKEGVSVKDLLAAIEAKGSPRLHSARVVDYYQGKQIPVGFRGLTVSCVYRASDRTLTEEELAPVHNSICSLLEERFSVKLR